MTVYLIQTLGLAPILPVAAVVLGIVLLIASARRKPKGYDIEVPAAPPRPSLLFGYYGTAAGQLQQTIDHINLLWFGYWRGPAGIIEDLRASGLPCVLDVAPWLYAIGGRGALNRNDDAVRALFDLLRIAGVLAQVRYLVACDEPNLSDDGTVDTLPAAVERVRRVALDYPELTGVQLVCIYAGGGAKPMPHCDLFDVVGADNYDRRSAILVPGAEYDAMCAQLRPDQRTLLVPGASYGQDPTPFLHFANAQPRVSMVVPFLHTPPSDGPGDLRPLPDLPVYEAYRAAGRSVKGAA